MLVDLQLPVDRAAFRLNDGQTIDDALAQANDMLAKEAKKHFGAGKVTVGRLDDGRFYFRHLMLGTMIRVPDELAISAQRELLHSVLPAVRIAPPAGQDPVEGVHGVWARQSWVDKFLANERAKKFQMVEVA